jgi:hypothetical protein
VELATSMLTASWKQTQADLLAKLSTVQLQLAQIAQHLGLALE